MTGLLGRIGRLLGQSRIRLERARPALRAGDRVGIGGALWRVIAARADARGREWLYEVEGEGGERARLIAPLGEAEARDAPWTLVAGEDRRELPAAALLVYPAAAR